MNVLRATVLAVAAILTALATTVPAAADQNDGRLDGLFAKLLDLPDQREAQDVELRIWGIWREYDDNAIVELMRQGYRGMEGRDFRAALRAFDPVVAIAPVFAEGWNARATLYYLMGRHEDSLADIKRTLVLEPRHFGALSGRGLVYAALEQWRPALDAFEKALEVNPHMTGARTNADAIREQIGDQDI